MEIKNVCRYQRAINFFSQSKPNIFSFVNYHFFKKTPMKCFQCFLRGKSIESFIGIFLKVMIQTFFFRKCWTQKIYQIENSDYGQESLGFKILENVCFFFHTFYFWSTYQVVTREGQVIVFFGLTVSPNLFRRSKCLMFKMFRRSKCFDAQNVSSLSTLKKIFK